MLIAIDYDGTFTADPHLWCAFIGSAKQRGHSVVCITGRKSPPDFTRDPPLPGSVPIVCCVDGEHKRNAARKAGLAVDVWIDDMPEMIGPTLILDWSAAASSAQRAQEAPSNDR